jgi:hypothetical protein
VAQTIHDNFSCLIAGDPWLAEAQELLDGV